MRKQIFKDYSRIDFSTPQGRAKVFGALQYFASGQGMRDEAEKVRKALQAFGTSGDFPEAARQVLEKFHALPAYDNTWEEIFDVRDFTGTNESGFDILDVEDGLSFRKIPTGDKVHIFKMGGAKVSVDFDIYGGGLGWSRKLIDDKKWWTLEDNAVAFVNKQAYDQAAAYIALIEAILSDYNVAWQQPQPAGLAVTDNLYMANRDVQTLNKAAIDIINDLKDKGYGVDPRNTVFKVLCPLELTGRLNRALGLLLQGFGGSPNLVNFKYQLLPTTMLQSTSSYYVCVPKIKAKAGIRMRLTIFNKFEIESYEDIAVGWYRHGGAIGDQEQFRRCATT
jgi:hypothetical protein